MELYTISPSFDKNRMFILKKSEIEKRFDPQFYKQEYKDNLEKIRRIKHKQLGEVVKFSTETWNQKDFFDSTFPYIEISEIDTVSGEIQNIVQVEKEKAASRAKMIVRESDIIISTTRPNRGAISLIRKEHDFSIASTGFSVIRNITNPEIDRGYLFTILRQQIILKQFEQRSSGGNYPAITQEELCSVTIPLPEIEIQKKIVKVFNDCFAQKQKNEAEADKLLSSIDDYLLNALGIKLPEPPENTLKSRMFTTTLREISGVRLDPNFHKAEFEQLISAIKKITFSNLKRLIAFSNEAWDQKSLFSSSFPYVEISEINTTTGEITQIVEVEKDSAPSRARMIVRTGDILISTTRPSRGAITLYLHDSISIASTGFSVIRQKYKEKVNFTYLWFVLRCKISLKQMEQRSSGGNYPAITQEELGNVLIPLPPLAKQKEIAEHITGIRQQAQQLKDKTKELLKKASKEIEEILLN